MKMISCLFLAVLSYDYNLGASEALEANENFKKTDFSIQTKYFSPKEKLEFARRMPQTTDLEKALKSAAHEALKNDTEVLFYLKIALDEAWR